MATEVQPTAHFSCAWCRVAKPAFSAAGPEHLLQAALSAETIVLVSKILNPGERLRGLRGLRTRPLFPPLPLVHWGTVAAAFHLSVLLFLPNEYGDNETNETIFIAMPLRCTDENYQIKGRWFLSSLGNENTSCMKCSALGCSLVPC